MADDGFHEIQLGKKQLVFAFMAGAVMLVIVFLIGVWVGKETRRPETETAAAEVPIADVTPDAPQPPTQVAASELDYTARLQGGGKATGKAEEPAKPIEPPTPAADAGTDSAPVATPPPTAAKAAPKPTPAVPSADPAAKKTAPAATSAPVGTWHVQAAAFKDKKPADTLVASLVKKGYAASVSMAASGLYRYKVRIGPFADRASADAASARLKKEEGLSPFVQR